MRQKFGYIVFLHHAIAVLLLWRDMQAHKLECYKLSENKFWLLTGDEQTEGKSSVRK